jgi:hypothetical protein
MVQIAKIVIGTIIDCAETVRISAEIAKKALVVGLHFAIAFVYADLSTSA